MMGDLLQGLSLATLIQKAAANSMQACNVQIHVNNLSNFCLKTDNCVKKKDKDKTIKGNRASKLQTSSFD